MAKETRSESLVRIANLKYERAGRAKVVKKDPAIKLTTMGLLFAGSRGLDYAGIVSPGGKHIEFEVKETEKGFLRLKDIRVSQIDCIESLDKFQGDVFLLVFFKQFNEWYRLEWPALKQILESQYNVIPIPYFRAFGFAISNDEEWPDYLSPEQHPDCNQLRSTYPQWMPIPRKKKPLKPAPKHNQLDMDARKQRIINATFQGVRNARRKQHEVQTIVNRKILEKRYGDN